MQKEQCDILGRLKVNEKAAKLFKFYTRHCESLGRSNIKAKVQKNYKNSIYVNVKGNFQSTVSSIVPLLKKIVLAITY